MAIDQRFSPNSAATTTNKSQQTCKNSTKALHSWKSLMNQRRSIKLESQYNKGRKKSCLKNQDCKSNKDHKETVTFHHQNTGTWVLGLHQFSNEEYQSYFVSAKELEKTLEKASNVVAEEMNCPYRRQHGEKRYMTRGLEKLMNSDKTIDVRRQASEAVLKKNDIKKYKVISQECLYEALSLANSDAQFASRYHQSSQDTEDISKPISNNTRIYVGESFIPTTPIESPVSAAGELKGRNFLRGANDSRVQRNSKKGLRASSESPRIPPPPPFNNDESPSKKKRSKRKPRRSSFPLRPKILSGSVPPVQSSPSQRQQTKLSPPPLLHPNSMESPTATPPTGRRKRRVGSPTKDHSKSVPPSSQQKPMVLRSIGGPVTPTPGRRKKRMGMGTPSPPSAPPFIDSLTTVTTPTTRRGGQIRRSSSPAKLTGSTATKQQQQQQQQQAGGSAGFTSRSPQAKKQSSPIGNQRKKRRPRASSAPQVPRWAPPVEVRHHRKSIKTNPQKQRKGASSTPLVTNAVQGKQRKDNRRLREVHRIPMSGPNGGILLSVGSKEIFLCFE